MPPSGSPVKEQILDDLVSTLQTISAGDDYYTTVEQVVRVDGGPMELKMFPAVAVLPSKTEYDREGSQGTTTISAYFYVQLSLFVRTRTDGAEKIERFIRDVHKAVIADRTRGDRAVHTAVIQDEVTYPTEDDEPFTIADLVVEIVYRTRFDDLNTPS